MHSIGSNRTTTSILILLLTLFCIGTTATRSESTERILWEYRNRGTGLYENQDYADAIPELLKCVELAPESAADLINLGLAYYRDRQWENSIVQLEKARGIDDSYPHIAYTLGLILKKNDSFEAAVAEFQKVIAADPAEASAYYSLGVVLEKLERDDEAEKAFQATVRHNPDHASAHYFLFKYAKVAKRRDEARREMKTFSRLQKEIGDKQRTEEAYEQSQYLEPIVPPQLSFMPPGDDHRSKISFVDVTAEAGLPRHPGNVCLVDLDGDDDLDLWVVRCGGTKDLRANRLYLNDGSGHFTDATAESTAGVYNCGHHIAAGDFDNSGTVDLLIIGYNDWLLLSNDGRGRFTDVSTEADLTDSQTVVGDAAFFDYDHDGDLDLVVGVYGLEVDVVPAADSWPEIIDEPGVGNPLRRHLVPQRNRIYRNNGDSSFTRVADSLWPGNDSAWTIDLACGDFDGDDDTDVLTVNVNAPCRLHLNQRQGRLSTVEPFGVEGAEHGTAADFDNDGDLDVLLLRAKTAHLYVNDGRAQFQEKPLPVLTESVTGKNVAAIQALDFDNDGLVDILVAFESGVLEFYANNGSGEFEMFGSPLTPLDFAGAYDVTLNAGDINGDGDLDIVGSYFGVLPFILENRGGEDAHWLEVQLVGERVPKQGIGAKIEIKAGPYYQRRDVHQWPVHFGLGEIDKIDVLRITWTNGIVQNMTDVPIDTIYRVEEIVRADASCPFLYTFDGEQFNYVNDILGVAAMGVPLAEAFYHHPDPDEYVKIDGHLLIESDGLYLLRLAAEFKEIAYIDQLRLLVIDHPLDVDVYPNERFTEPPFMEPGIHTIKDKRYPVTAVDHDGRDVLSLIELTDLEYPSNMPMTSYDGLAETHWIEFDLGDLHRDDKIMLYLTGWIYWSSASANVAISQNEQYQFEAVSLSVPSADGNWVRVIDDIGLPNGKNSTMPVDLTDKFLSDDYRVRLTTNMVVYWDEVFYGVNESPAPVLQHEATLVSADLHYRGFSAMRKDSLGMEFFDYARADRFGPWRQHDGRYTRYGPVMELLGEIDDRYVIYGPGEEIALEFDAPELLDIPDGWTRDFFLYAFGWIKDGDPNTAHSETVGPLPFIGMSGYPYPPAEQPRADEIARDLTEWLTRDETQTIEPLRE